MRRVLPDSWIDGPAGPSTGGVAFAALADRFATPLNVVDEAHVTGRLNAFRDAFGSGTTLTYAGKAFLCGALVHLLDDAGWHIDVVSGGELELVRRAGFPMDRVVLHGNAKSRAELETAVATGVGRVVVDHAAEADALADLVRAGRTDPVRVLLRLNVDLDPDTHEKVKTVGPAAHFGMEPAAAADVADSVSKRSELVLSGVHIHAGSQIKDLGLFRAVAAAAVDFVAPRRDRFDHAVELDLGGGFAVRYVVGDDVPSIDAYADALRGGLRDADVDGRVGEHRLVVEPGRSVIANAGITLYRIHARKRLTGLGDVLAVDGGLSDNPRPSLYGAAYEMVNVSRSHETDRKPFRVVGRHCESGDVIATDVELPAGSDVGDLIVVAATGAYVFAMSSRYNGVGRPAVAFVRDGAAREVVRRETDDDLLACDRELTAG
ncbi:MAG: diaminopimelate decarboxylase [Gemmatimonadetes bacterium]|nr:diaminopimelate decarboxylase [Gemmatimonadota bacterium]